MDILQWVTYGPFPNTSERVAGFFIIDVKSKEEARDWLLKAPDPQGHDEGQIELRQIRKRIVKDFPLKPTTFQPY